MYASICGWRTCRILCFSIDGTRMYFADTPERVIWEFDYDTDEGTPGNRRVFCDLHDQPGKPDGSITDSDGCLWNAQWGGSRVVRYTPAGKIDRIVELPCRFPTCPAFGGSDLGTLYVTSARREGEGAALVPADGALLAVRTGCRGIAETLFCA
jgi:L-arabinonolactonase